MGEPNCNNQRQRVALQTVESSLEQNPPEYSIIISPALVSTPNHDRMEPPTTDTDVNERMTSETFRHHITNARRHTTTNFPSQKPLEKMDSFSLTMPRRQITIVASTPNDRCNFRNLTAHDVAQLLRSTQGTQRNEDNNIGALASNDSSTFSNNSVSVNNNEDFSLTRSIEELISNEVPVGESSAATTFCEREDIQN